MVLFLCVFRRCFALLLSAHNVPGAFSSAGGEDFRIVLEETICLALPSCTVPRPAGRRWHPAGAVMGDGYSLAWQTLNAQYWGVPKIALPFTSANAAKL